MWVHTKEVNYTYITYSSSFLTTMNLEEFVNWDGPMFVTYHTSEGVRISVQDSAHCMELCK